VACSRCARKRRSRGSGLSCKGHRERQDAHSFSQQQAVEFGAEIGEYRGVVRAPRRVFQRLLQKRPTLSAASRRTIFSGPGSRISPSESYVAAS